jgi:hypothetical protein
MIDTQQLTDNTIPRVPDTSLELGPLSSLKLLQLFQILDPLFGRGEGGLLTFYGFTKKLFRGNLIVSLIRYLGRCTRRLTWIGAGARFRTLGALSRASRPDIFVS